MRERCIRLKVRCVCGWTGSRHEDNPCVTPCPNCKGPVTLKPKRTAVGHQPSAAQKDMDGAIAATEKVLVALGSRTVDAENMAPAMLLLLLQHLGRASADAPVDRFSLLSGTRLLLDRTHMACMTVCRGGRYDWLTDRGIAVLSLMRKQGIKPAREMLL